MKKYLDTIDYNGIVLNTFQLPEKDFYKYYSNVVSDHLSDNPDLFDELILAIERQIKWYRDQHKTDYSYDVQGTDADGNKIKITHLLPLKEADECNIPFIFPNVIRSINKSFFDKQIKAVNILSIEHNLKTLTHQSKPIMNNQSKDYPELPDCFIDKNYFLNDILNHPQVSDIYTLSSDGSHNLKKGKKSLLAGMAHRLLDTKKLNPDIIKTYQDLARVFCPYFNVGFNSKEDKQFQPGRAKIEYFNFIK